MSMLHELVPMMAINIQSPVCEISGRPIDNVCVKSSWPRSNFQNFVYNVQSGLCKIEIGL